MATENSTSPYTSAVLEALERARREQRPIGVWLHQDRHSIRVQAAACPEPWVLVKIVQPDDATGEVVR